MKNQTIAQKEMVVAEIAIPFQVLPGLIKALQRQLEQRRQDTAKAAAPADPDQIN